MGKMIICEIRRMLSSRTTIISLAIAIAISIIFAFLIISFESYYYMDDNGAVVGLNGIKAIKAQKENQGILKGEVTVEKIEKAFEKYVEICSQYGDTVDDVPLDIYYKELYSFGSELDMLLTIYMNDDTGYYLTNLGLTDEDFTKYYENRENYIKDFILMKYGQHAYDQAEKLIINTKTPFLNEYGIGSNAIEYIGLLQWLILMITSIIIVPQFAQGYQTQADDIYRCTKNGRVKFAFARILSSLLLIVPLYLICMTAYLLIVNTAFGWSGLQNSVQTLLSVISIVPMTAGQAILYLLICGLLTTLSVSVFTLFASALGKTPTNALVLTLGAHFLPTFITVMSGANIANWIKNIMPSSGVGLISGIFLETCASISYLKIGSFNIWTPRVILGCSIVYIPLFIFLAVRIYCKYER